MGVEIFIHVERKSTEGWVFVDEVDAGRDREAWARLGWPNYDPNADIPCRGLPSDASAYVRSAAGLAAAAQMDGGLSWATTDELRRVFPRGSSAFADVVDKIEALGDRAVWWIGM